MPCTHINVQLILNFSSYHAINFPKKFPSKYENEDYFIIGKLYAGVEVEKRRENARSMQEKTIFLALRDRCSLRRRSSTRKFASERFIRDSVRYMRLPSSFFSASSIFERHLSRILIYRSTFFSQDFYYVLIRRILNSATARDRESDFFFVIFGAWVHKELNSRGSSSHGKPEWNAL